MGMRVLGGSASSPWVQVSLPLPFADVSLELRRWTFVALFYALKALEARYAAYHP